jgi:hypothetical protein
MKFQAKAALQSPDFDRTRRRHVALTARPLGPFNRASFRNGR